MTIRAVEGAIRHIKCQERKIRKQWPAKRLPLNEWPTRYILIDPVLAGLGWDVHDYDQCEVEAPISPGHSRQQADYLLYDHKGHPVAVIEAKCFEDDLETEAYVEQLEGYAQEYDQGLGVLTNGVEWHIYRLNQSKDFMRKQVIKVNLLDGRQRDQARTLNEWLNASRWGW